MALMVMLERSREPEPEKPPTLENTAALFRTLESLERQYQVRVESQTLVNNSLRSQYRKYERLSGLVKSLQANLFSVHGDILRAQSKRSKQQQQATRDIRGQKGSVLRRIIRIKTEIQGLQRLCTIVDSGGSSGEQKEEGAPLASCRREGARERACAGATRTGGVCPRVEQPICRPRW